MAIPIAFMALIIRADKLDVHYPGGSDAYRKRKLYRVDDGYLIGLNIMSSGELDEEIEHLLGSGLPESSFAVIDQMLGLLEPKDWIEWGELDGRRMAWIKEEVIPGKKQDANGKEPNSKLRGAVVIHPPGTPFPPGHPFARPTIIFSSKSIDESKNEKDKDKPKNEN